MCTHIHTYFFLINPLKPKLHLCDYTYILHAVHIKTMQICYIGSEKGSEENIYRLKCNHNAEFQNRASNHTFLDLLN